LWGWGGGLLGDHHSFSFFLSFSMRLYVYCTAFIIRAIIKLFAVNDFYFLFFFPKLAGHSVGSIFTMWAIIKIFSINAVFLFLFQN